MSKKETKAERRVAAREARLAAQRKRQKARRRRQLMTWGALGLAVAAVAAFVVYRQTAGRANVEAAARQAGCGAIEEFADLGREHIESGTPHEPYNSNPPTSGPHYGTPAAWGSYPDSVDPETLVHNLEHGGVIVHYNDLNESEIEELESLVESYSDGVVLNPNPDIDKPIAMASWQHLRTCERSNEIETVISGFVSEFCGKGPEKVPLAC